MSHVTQILQQIEAGDPAAAEQLLPLVYDELRKLAAARLNHESPGQTLQATALVHEAYTRLVDTDRAQQWNSRGHFFAAAAEAMRRRRPRCAGRAGPRANRGHHGRHVQHDAVHGMRRAAAALADGPGRPGPGRRRRPLGGVQERHHTAGATHDGAARPGPCAINCTNDFEVYSFHSGGANAVFTDGSVHFLGASIDIHVLARLVTRAGGEVVSGSDF